jgi:endoglucanase
MKIMKIKKKPSIISKNAMSTFLFSTFVFANAFAFSVTNHEKEAANTSKVTKKVFANRTINCNSIAQITAALADAQAGDEIIIASGTYNATQKIEDVIGKFNYFTSNANGTAANPIILRGASSSSKPILRAADANKYSGTTMSITGDYWIIKDLQLDYGQKGLILDTANYCQLLNLSVNHTSEEGIHLRSGSSYNLIQNCKVTNTGEGSGKAGFGEGIYVGSDQKQHGTYAPNCDHNTIDKCSIGPNVTAEGIDVKEGTQYTEIKNSTFSGAGISGENSADAFVDIKGGYAFIHDNTFNSDGSSVIASGLDFQQRDGVNSGYRIAIFNNSYNFGSGGANIPTCRKKGGNPSEIHVWNNTRNVGNNDFPVSDGTENFITKSCPSWNIIPCGGGSPNQAPSVSITSPSNDSNFTTGTSITITATANDSDGTVAKVEFFRGSTKLGEDTSNPYQYTISSATAGSYSLTAKATDNDGATKTSTAVDVTVSNIVSTNIIPTVSITSPSNGSSYSTGTSITISASASDSDGTVSKVEFFNGSTKLGEDTSSPYQYIIASAVAGTYNLTAKATDNSGGTKTSTAVSVSVTSITASGCNFGTPTTVSLPTFDRATFSYVYVLGTNKPSITNIKTFSINWDSNGKTLTKFAVNTKNGLPDFYVDLRSKITQNFSASSPSLTIANSGIGGLDGTYWVTKKGTDFVMVSKTGGYTIYFSNSATVPNCSSSREALVSINNTFNMYPNPARELVTIDGLEGKSTNVIVVDFQGKTVITQKLSENNTTLNIATLNAGIYLVNIESVEVSKTMLLNVIK